MAITNQMLLRLPIEVQGRIKEKYGSLEKFYSIVCFLGYMDWKTFSSPSDNQIVKNKLQTIEDELASWGLDSLDAVDVINEITTDVSEAICHEIMRKKLGDNWKALVEEYSKLLGI